MKLEQMYLIRITVICIDVDFVILTDVIVSHPPRLIYTIIGTVYPSYTKMMLNTCFYLKKTKKTSDDEACICVVGSVFERSLKIFFIK